MSFQRLIRFVSTDGKTLYGDLVKNIPTLEIEGTKVAVLEGDIESGFHRTGAEATVQKLLCPLPKAHIIQCIGLNYKQHAAEANLKIPEFPMNFTKPPETLAGPLETIDVDPSAQKQLDYEGELVVVIGRDAKNVSAADALSCVAGYTTGNDLSARDWQLPITPGQQFCYGKSFDKFAPIGPAIVSPSVIPDPQKLHLVTKVNGKQVQETGTDDMIFSVAQIIEHLTRGRTLKAGSLVMTGTPSGIGLFIEGGLLKHGDVVEVTIDEIGSIYNKIAF
ncbi:hypothetical protein CDV55_105167 [Aspergillus turcosus]|nr:hypothetical protein CDV55_105167 [Aspergillus turcosus]